ncbi:MAG: hypothetical protein ACYTBP_12405 [Planctomycetota bacterium]|jgi:hypothetical protein
MALPKETIELIKHLADDLEQWIDKKLDEPFPDFQLLSETIFYAGNVDKKAAVQQLGRIDRILLSLQKHNQGWADALRKKVEDIKATLSSVDSLVGCGYSRRQCVHTLETPSLRLLQTLRDIEDLATKKPEEPELGSKSALISEEKKTAKSNVSGMPWQEAQKKAEALVDEKGYLGHKKLYEAIGCSDNTLRKAIEKSPKLQQAKEQYESTSTALKAVGLTTKVIATYETTSGPKLSDTEADEILVEMLERTKRERPEMFESTKTEIDKMDPDQKRGFAAVYKRDYQNKKNAFKKEGPETQRQYKQV